MKTVDDESLAHTVKFMDKSRKENKPFFVWLNPTRMHVITHLSDKYHTMRNSENGIISGLDWFPTLVAAAGNPNLAQEFLQGKTLGNRTCKVHLDGYNQMNLITGKGPSARHEVFYFAEGTLGAVRVNDYKYRFIDQPGGWLGGTVKVDWPILVNLRLDPFERTGLSGSWFYANWLTYQFWRFVFVPKVVGEYAQTFIAFPPMQKGASFNMDRVKEQIQKAIEHHKGQ